MTFIHVYFFLITVAFSASKYSLYLHQPKVYLVNTNVYFQHS